MATTATTRVAQETAFPPPLCLAVAWGGNPWTLGVTTGAAQRPRARHVPAGECHTVWEERRWATRRFGLPEAARVVRCDEAGREGLWLPRLFGSQGVAHAVVDSARIDVQRRSRRAKTERLDGHTLRTMLRRHAAGAQKGWSGGRVPSVGDADRRQRQRELLTTQRARTRVSNRRKGLLAGCGMRLGWPGEVEPPRAQVRQWDGSPLPAALRARLQREWQKGQGLTAQLTQLEAARRAAVRPREDPVLEQVRPWTTRRGMGGNRAWLLVMACFAGRNGQTPTPGGAFAGRTPTPYQRGQAARELGITQAGKGSMRTMARELAWGGGRCQPERLLPPWDQARGGQGRTRLRNMGLVALARKLLMALWRCLKPGEIPAGAVRTGQASGESGGGGGRSQGERRQVWAGVGHSLRGTGSPRAPMRRRGASLRASQAPRAPAGSGA